ncbi:unnamed protein product [Calypogeia fissa]
MESEARSGEGRLTRWIFAGVVSVVLGVAGFFFLQKRQKNMGSVCTRPREEQTGPSAEFVDGQSDLPDGITEVNDSVFQLYYPPSGTHDMDIIFFHGLQLGDFEKAYWKAWVATDNDRLIWPKEWLSLRFPGARILSVSYNSSAMKVAGQNDMYLLGENLVADIILDAETGCGQNCPVFLVGHSLGGIVIKQLIISAIRERNGTNPDTERRKLDRLNNFLDKFKGAFFYATPHLGSRAADFASLLPQASIILKLLRTLDTERGRINEEFRKLRGVWNARTYGVAESLPMKFLTFHETVVVEGSARHDVDGYYTHPKANHITVCKARDQKDPTVIGKLSQFIMDTLPADTTIQTPQTINLR